MSKRMRTGRGSATAERLESRRLMSEAAIQLVKDVNTSRLNATFVPTNLAAAGAVAYFADHDGTAGDELWRTDGSAAGTTLVKDINPGPAGSFPGGFATLNGVTYFDAVDATAGAELWRTDGTAAGTYRVADVNPGTADSSPSDLTVANGYVFFFANDGVHGREVWRSDGTATGTVLVDDTQAGSAGQTLQPASTHRLVATGNGKLFFYATSGSTTGLYTTTGDVGNQTLVTTATYSIVGPGLLAATSQVFYEDSLGYVYQSDGTAAGTATADATNSSVTTPTVAGNYLYYDRGSTLYVVGGGVKRTVTGAFSSPALVGAANGMAYFSAVGTDGYNQLWLANVGGFGGTLVRDAVSAVAGGTAAGSGFAFVAGSSSLGYTLDYTTGTTAGAITFAALGPINAGGSLSAPSSLTGFGTGQLLFVNTDATNGTQPWASNLTAAGTGLLKAVYPGTAGSQPFLWNTTVTGRLLFTADDGVAGRELWASDGTAAGTKMVKDLNPGSGPSNPLYPVAVGTEVYFAAYDPTDGNALFATDGTAAGTAVMPGTAATSPQPLAAVDGALLFAATDAAHGTELWRTDGTTTSIVADLNPGSASSNPSAGVVLNGVYYFAATDATHGTELWRSDGTAAGTYLLADVNAGSASSAPANLFAYGNRVLFAAVTAAAGTELWSTDGTAAGTVLVKDLYPGTANGSPANFALYNGRAYFSAKDATGTGLWSTDGTADGTTRVAAAVSPSRPVAADGALFFYGSDATHAGVLFTSRGTAATTGPVLPDTPTAISGTLSAVGGRVFFVGNDAADGYELWSSDGTAAGTGPVQDLFPGPYSGASSPIVGLNGTAYLSGTDGVTGVELYKVPDTFPPELTAVAAVVTPARTLTFTFSENVSAGLSAASLQLQDLTTGTAVAVAATGFAYDPATNTATFALPPAALATGRYRATIPAAALVDAAGNAAVSAAAVEFLSVAGGGSAVAVGPSADGGSVVVTRGGATALSTPLAGLGAVLVTGSPSATVVALPLGGGISVDGPATVVGTAGAHTVTATAAGLTFDTTAVTTPGPVAFDPAGGTDALTVTNTRLTFAPAPSANTARVFSSLAVATGATLDVADNDLILTGSTVAAVSALAATGFANGTWAGAGIDSAAAAADARHLAGVGVIANANGSAALYTTFDGVAVAASAVLVKTTRYGDANLDGLVNAADYTRVDAGFVGKLTGWVNGDLNYDGVVDGSDYSLMDNAFNQQPTAGAAVATPAAAVAAAVPARGVTPVPPPTAVWTADDERRRKGRPAAGGDLLE